MKFMPVPVSTMEAPSSPNQLTDHDNTEAIEVSDSEQENQVCEFGQFFLCLRYLPQTMPQFVDPHLKPQKILICCNTMCLFHLSQRVVANNVCSYNIPNSEIRTDKIKIVNSFLKTWVTLVHDVVG